MVKWKTNSTVGCIEVFFFNENVLFCGDQDAFIIISFSIFSHLLGRLNTVGDKVHVHLPVNTAKIIFLPGSFIIIKIKNSEWKRWKCLYFL